MHDAYEALNRMLHGLDAAVLWELEVEPFPAAGVVGVAGAIGAVIDAVDSSVSDAVGDAVRAALFEVLRDA